MWFQVVEIVYLQSVWGYVNSTIGGALAESWV